MSTQILAPSQAARQPLTLRFAAIIPLGAILLLQTLVSLSLHNTAFQDEALYLYAGRQILTNWLGGPPIADTYSTYFSGLPQFYPVLAGGLDMLGGVEAARMLSLVCMLTVTAMVYLLTSRLFSRESAVLAAGLFAVQGSVLFLGRLATYDALALALLAVGAVLAQRVSGARWLLAALLLGPVLLLAVLAKYAAVLFVPSVLALLVLETYRQHGIRQVLVRTALVLTPLALAAVVAFSIPQVQAALVGLRSTTTNRTALFATDRWTLVWRAATFGGLLFLIAVAGGLTLLRTRPLLVLMLLGTGLLAPVYHIASTESISLHKHVAFGMVFLAPLAGVAGARLIGGEGAGGRRWLAGLALLLVVFGLGFGQAQRFYAEWANSDAMVRVLQTQVRPGSGRILAEESEVPRYYLQNVVQPWQWSHLYWFQYSRNGEELTGEAAYKAAIADGYFDLVVLRYGPNAALAHAIDGGLRDGSRYEEIARLPYYTMFGQGDYYIWRRVR